MTEKELARIEKQASLAGPARKFLDHAAYTCECCGQGTSIFNERVQQIIKEARAWFKAPGQSSDSHVAIRYIAALVEVSDLQEALEYRVTKGEEARLKLHGDQTAG